MNYYRLKLEVSLDKSKLDEEKFTSVVEKIFKQVSKLDDYESAEQKMGFVMENRHITIDILKNAKMLTSSKLLNALNYISKYIDYEDTKIIGTISLSSSDNSVDLVAYKNLIYLSSIDCKENQRVQNITNLDNKSVSFRLPDEMEKIPVETNVFAAHVILEEN
ncbi:hypothetical protein CUC43_34010 (plasmid) [Bacillus thuringiensis LM1212]|uniref:hypothetical protein n=1 Tax=Bacillus cereus group TaxID=86661 RepID=UPI0003FB096A|nr:MULTISPECIES: hypothetical protein [Bacillus cereus group]AXY11579.1 hypothetical protein CUC43_34010 [Bacillus thuringiensis LM1212]QDF27452.1 hypothetical protein FJR70_32495 [Bacillus tropicus]QUG99339.1 hypothetical protein HCM98_31510 [Bacillus tropicus]